MTLQFEFRRKQGTGKAAWTTNSKGNIVKVINGAGNACDLDSVFFAATLIQSNYAVYKQMGIFCSSEFYFGGMTP
jgi:hypothetical protein